MKLETIRSEIESIVASMPSLTEERLIELMAKIDIAIHEQDAPVAQPDSAPAF